MKTRLFLDIACRLMRVPAVAFHEHCIRQAVLEICKEFSLEHRTDAFGNVLVESRRGRVARPMALVAHLDHPGFEIVRQVGPRRLVADFLGGVPDHYFRKAVPLRLLPGNMPARLGRWVDGKRKFEVVAERKLESLPEYAVWELEDFRTRGGRIIGRACDDLIGVAAILTVLIELKGSRKNHWVMGAITRAEEIGFGGALSLSAAGTIPKSALVISLETSKEIPGVSMGAGVIVRVGDRSSVFDSSATRFLHENGTSLHAQDQSFKMQRALMGGGSCEGTVFHEAGYQTTALCVALGNYHNCGPRNQIAEEYVARADAVNMVRLLQFSAARMNRFDQTVGRLTRRLSGIRSKTSRKLRRSA